MATRSSRPSPGQGHLHHFDNRQEAAGLWYHDHAMAITRLNVYGGLAGGYLLRDRFDTGRPDNPLGLPAGEFEIPLVLQEKSRPPRRRGVHALHPDRPGRPLGRRGGGRRRTGQRGGAGTPRMVSSNASDPSNGVPMSSAVSRTGSRRSRMTVPLA